MATVQSREKRYANTRRRDSAFVEGYWVYIKVSPMKDVKCFEKKRKLNLRYVGPYEEEECDAPSTRFRLDRDCKVGTCNSRLHTPIHDSENAMHLL